MSTWKNDIKVRYLYHIVFPSAYSEEVTAEGLPLKPWISLSGDDDGKHYILYPVNEDKEDWTYEKHLIIETGFF